LTENPCVAVTVAVLTIAGISMILTPTGALEGLGLEAASEREGARPNLVLKLTRDPNAHCMFTPESLAFLVLIEPES
jgi:hypothetical protein